jgi:predicted nuclease of predicted toxin-antitoxin system
VKLPEPYVFFVDRSLGRTVVVEALRAAGENAHAHDDFFPQNTPDAEWLVEVARRGWVILTKDKDIRRNEIERVAILRARAACFMLGRGDLSAFTMGRTLIAALPRMRRALRRFGLPLAASVNLAGELRVLLADGQWLAPPREIR